MILLFGVQIYDYLIDNCYIKQKKDFENMILLFFL